jgi:hypothetical protein
MYGFGEIPSHHRFSNVLEVMNRNHEEGKYSDREGSQTARYGRGNLYKELSSGFVGPASEIENKFGIPMRNVNQYTKSGKPILRGKNKGRQFVVWEE